MLLPWAYFLGTICEETVPRWHIILASDWKANVVFENGCSLVVIDYEWRGDFWFHKKAPHYFVSILKKYEESHRPLREMYYDIKYTCKKDVIYCLIFLKPVHQFKVYTLYFPFNFPAFFFPREIGHRLLGNTIFTAC